MTMEELIGWLASDATPVRPRPATSVVLPAVAVGAAAAIVMVKLFFGVSVPADRSSLAAEIAFTVPFLAAGLAALISSLRPGSDAGFSRYGVLVASLFLAFSALDELMVAPIDWADMLSRVGRTHGLWCIPAIAVPVAASILLGLREEAPTHFRLTGAAIGMISGAIAAATYAFVDREIASGLLISHYSAGIGLATLSGFLAGPRLLRW